MSEHTYSEYLEVSPSFESVVDLAVDQRNRNLWREYIVGKDMEDWLEVICQSLNCEDPDVRKGFWIQGSYGTGKSYAALFVKHLLEEPLEVVDSYLGKSARLSAFRNRFMKIRRRGDYLVIWKSGCVGVHDGNDLLLEAESAIREALSARFGDKADYGEDSLQDAVLAQLRDEFHNWDYILDNTPLGGDYESAADLIYHVKSGDVKAIQMTAAEIRRKGWGLINSLDTFKKWVKTVIERNGLSKTGIFFIWDEFSEYVTHSENQTLLQELSMFAKESPFFITFIVHRVRDTTDILEPDGAKKNKDRQKISDRFHTVEFHITQDAAFDLIAGSIHCRNGMDIYWQEERTRIISRIRKYLPDMEFADDKIAERLDAFCPMHPMTIKLLSRVADNYAGAQRTMFRFMKDSHTPDLGFVAYIRKYGPDSQFCWLTPDWLWDYFFTRVSDYSDELKNAIATPYIQHYESKKNLVESSPKALLVFKVSMLLMAVMSNVRGYYGGKQALDGIAATVDCLETCLAGVMDKSQVEDILETLAECGALVLDEDGRNVKHLQMPYTAGPGDNFKEKYEENNKTYTRYHMFAKNGIFSQAFEAQADDQNDVLRYRMKIAVCCAETASINTRLTEVQNELEKSPYKLGVLVVTVKDKDQGAAIQNDLCKRAADLQNPRLILALCWKPFTDADRKAWLTAITRRDLAAAAGVTGDVKSKEQDAQKIMASWIGEAVSGGKMTAWTGTQELTGIYGMAHLRKQIQVNVRDKLFPYAPETVCVTVTAYKSCNDKAPLAGIRREASTAQLKSVLNAIQQTGGLNLTDFAQMRALTGSRSAESIAALAKLIQDETERSGSRLVLDDLWHKLQAPPYGYYDNIVCGVLLGYVFSAFKKLGYIWTDSARSPHVLADTTISTMVRDMCKGKMTTDFLFAGSETWRDFRDYLKAIFNLDDAAVAEQTSGYQNVREAVTKSGSPFWAVKYLPQDTWKSSGDSEIAGNIVDKMQCFIEQNGDMDSVMSEIVRLFNGNGKIKTAMCKAFQNKNIMAQAFRNFLFQSSPQLEEIATKLAIQPQQLSDRLHMVMQGAIYTWTEKQVRKNLPQITAEYQYLDVLGRILGKTYQSIETVKRDLRNLFDHLSIPLSAIQKLAPDWYPALALLREVSFKGFGQMDKDKIAAQAAVLEQHGTHAVDCLRDARPVLADILSSMDIKCTAEELNVVYDGLKSLSCDTSLTQFEHALDRQINRISAARNRILLKERWTALTGTDTVKSWCSAHKAPLSLLVSRNFQQALNTLADVQQGDYPADSQVKNALNMLVSDEAAILQDNIKIDALFLKVMGEEYRDIWNSARDAILTRAKLQLGNDMSVWTASDLFVLQKILKEEQKKRVGEEKLVKTKADLDTMPEDMLRDLVRSFLEAHPEFCDDFSKGGGQL